MISGRRKSAARCFALSLLLAGAVLLPGCASRVPQYENAAGEAADIRVIPQSLSVFAERYAEGADTLLRSHADAVVDMAYFRQRFFQPWTMKAASPEAVQDVLNELDRSAEQRGFAENMHPWSEEAWEELRDKADLPKLRAVSGKKTRPAITVRGTNLRAVPTFKPRFSDVHGAGRGWPFDLFQHSALPVGLPLAVHHESADGAWLFVETSGIWGWIPAEDAAFAGAEFRKLWSRANLAAFVQDGVGLIFKSLGDGSSKNSRKMPRIRTGAYLAEADIGTVLPATRSGEVLLPMRGLDGMAYVVTASYAEYAAPRGFGEPSFGPAVHMPQSLTPRAVARIGDRMMGQSYGWGGLYGGRDCSAMMRDLFTPFGLWLPRNSARQAEAGARAEIADFSPEAKEKALREGARPFRTLIWMPGHIGLYVGQNEGRAAMFHNVWGLRTTLDDGREGRAVLGRAVITSLRPGAERGDIDSEKLLIERVGSFTVIDGDE